MCVNEIWCQLLESFQGCACPFLWVSATGASGVSVLAIGAGGCAKSPVTEIGILCVLKISYQGEQGE